MPTSKRGIDFLKSDEGKEIRLQLEAMMESASYNTTATYSAKVELYTDNLIPFVDKHMNYLIAHPSLNPSLYLSNLRLKTKLRVSV